MICLIIFKALGLSSTDCTKSFVRDRLHYKNLLSLGLQTIDYKLQKPEFGNHDFIDYKQLLFVVYTLRTDVVVTTKLCYDCCTFVAFFFSLFFSSITARLHNPTGDG